MLMVHFKDGSWIKAENAERIVKHMRLEDFTRYNTDKDYMDNINRRVGIYYNDKLYFTNAVEFLEELARVGYITRIERVEV